VERWSCKAEAPRTREAAAVLRSQSEADPRIATVVDMFQRIDIVAQREALRRMTDSNSTQRGTQC
jgi:hypothetical protein